MSLYNLYTTSKRHNSTLVPTGGVTGEMVLKAGTSLTKPVFLLYVSAKPTASMVGFEGRFYFIDDIVSVRNGLWELHCSVDVLSTYKANILNTSAFVLYDTTANTEIVDTRLSAYTSVHVGETHADSSFFETGCVLVGITGKHNTGVFAMTPAQARDLMNDIATDWLDDPDMLEIPDPTDFSNWDDAIGIFLHNVTIGLRQLIATGKAPDCIKSAIYVPVPSSKFSGSSATVWLGDYNTGITAKLLNTAGHADEVTSVSIPWYFSDWRRNSPYTQVFVKLPYVGVVPIPNSKVMGASSITIEVHVSQSGMVAYNLSANGIYIGRYAANCSSGFMIGASNINPLTGAMGAGTVAGAGIGAALATGPAGLAAAGTAAIVGFISAITSEPQSVGSSGGGAYTDSAVISCYCISHNVSADPAAIGPTVGTPSMTVKTISTLTGYVETKCFSVSGDMTDWERQEINRLMDGGVYIE